MSTVSAAKAILEADGTLLATATGGVWDMDEAGPNGLSRTLNGAAFDANEIIKPAVLLKLRSSNPDGMLADDANQYRSVREVLEVYFYEDAGYSNIETMRDRVYALLHAQQLADTDVFKCYWAGNVRGPRDTDLDANMERSEYTVHRQKSV